jgi:hypothetical protein
MRIERNDPCPCGSGDKFKRCCAQRPRSDIKLKIASGEDQESLRAFVVDAFGIGSPQASIIGVAWDDPREPESGSGSRYLWISLREAAQALRSSGHLSGDVDSPLTADDRAQVVGWIKPLDPGLSGTRVGPGATQRGDRFVSRDDEIRLTLPGDNVEFLITDD